MSMPAALDLNFVRSQFSAFEEPAWRGQAFFDNAGGSFACRQVIEHLNRYYRQTKLSAKAVDVRRLSDHPWAEGAILFIDLDEFEDYNKGKRPVSTGEYRLDETAGEE